MNTTLSPMLSVRGGAQSIDFCQAAFGANVLFRIDDDSGSVVAQSAISGAEFWVTDESPDHANYSPESLGGSTTRMVLIVDNPQVAFDHAVAAGAIEVWPVDERNGWLIGRVIDPFGHHREIGRPQP